MNHFAGTVIVIIVASAAFTMLLNNASGARSALQSGTGAAGKLFNIQRGNG